ncbi:MAG: hypothetical protein HGA86_06750 [Anaerolineaceae bacterium]|nr:hypothetical protein [Anaerolineaceae bacterium]
MSNGAGIFLTVVVILIVISGFGYMIREDQADAISIQSAETQAETLSTEMAELRSQNAELAANNTDLKKINQELVIKNDARDLMIANLSQDVDRYKTAYEEQYKIVQKQQDYISVTGGKAEENVVVPGSNSPIIPTILIAGIGIVLIAALGIWAITRPQTTRIYAQDTAWQPQMKLQPNTVQVLITADELAWLVEIRSSNIDPAVHWKPVKRSGRSFMQVAMSTSERDALVSRRRMSANI